jgi:hypothetical protein
MHRLLISIAIASFSLSIPRAAQADNYDKFLKTQVVEFDAGNSEKCQEKKIEVTQKGSKTTYELCITKNRPVFLRTSFDGTPAGVSIFKKGKLVQISLWEATGGVGFRNEQPVVEWSSGEFSPRRVNWNLSAAEKSKFLKMAAQEKQILRKFGLR